MNAITFDTLKYVKTLEEAGVPPAQAEAMARAQADAMSTSELATKADIQLAIAELRADLIKWMVGLSLAQLGLLVGILLKLAH